MLHRTEEDYVSQLYFEKISRYDRPKEPVTVSIPFAEGHLSDLNRLVILDQDEPLPAQKRVLAHWPDGSIKWLLVHLQPDLPGNDSKTLTFALSEKTEQLGALERRVTVEEGEGGISVDTGPLSFVVPRAGFLPVSEVKLDGHLLWEGEALTGFSMLCGEDMLSSTKAQVTLEIEEAGPLRGVILVHGKHRTPSGQERIELHGRITAYAGKPYIAVEHTFYHTEDEGTLSLKEVGLKFAPNRVPGRASTPKLALGEGYYRTNIQQGTEPIEQALTADTLLYQSNEHYVDCFYGDFWADWRDDESGLTLSIHQAHQNFPKKLRVTSEGIECGLFPSDAPPAKLYQGMGKTHRIMLHFHDGTTPLEELSTRSLQFQLPDRPALPRSWYRANNPWRSDFFPEQIPDRILLRLTQWHDSRPKALGMFHFGDAPDAGYTDQGRGHGSIVWVNNEYDRAHACTLFYALTGERRALESGLVAARHWLDVDLCRRSDDPLRQGGLIYHSAHHVTGGVSPSHEWVEGLLDYYHLTGRKEGLEAAHSIAENVLRHMKRSGMHEPGAISAREPGWALRTIVAMEQETGEERFRSEARRIAEDYVAWHERFDGILAPYTSHSMPRVPFMIAIAMNSLAHYLLIEDHQQVKALIAATADDLLEHCLGPSGVLYYKELPSLRRPAPTTHAIETFTYAYRLTGDKRYLNAAARQFAVVMEGQANAGGGPKRYIEEDGAVVQGRGGGRGFASTYTSLITFICAAGQTGILDKFEFPV